MSASSTLSAPERSRTAFGFRSVGVWSEAVCNDLAFRRFICCLLPWCSYLRHCLVRHRAARSTGRKVLGPTTLIAKVVCRSSSARTRPTECISSSSSRHPDRTNVQSTANRSWSIAWLQTCQAETTATNLPHLSPEQESPLGSTDQTERIAADSRPRCYLCWIVSHRRLLSLRLSVLE